MGDREERSNNDIPPTLEGVALVASDEPLEDLGGQRVIDSWPPEVRRALEARGYVARPCYQHENCVLVFKEQSPALTAYEFTPDDFDLGALWLLDELEAELARWEAWLDAPLDEENLPCEPPSWDD